MSGVGGWQNCHPSTPGFLGEISVWILSGFLREISVIFFLIFFLTFPEIFVCGAGGFRGGFFR